MSESLPSSNNQRLALATVTGLVVGGGLTLLLQRLYRDFGAPSPLTSVAVDLYKDTSSATSATSLATGNKTNDPDNAGKTTGKWKKSNEANQNVRDIVDRIVTLQSEVQILTENISILVKNQALTRSHKLEISEEEFQDPLAQKILTNGSSGKGITNACDEDANEIYYDPPDLLIGNNKEDEEKKKILIFYKEIDILLDGNDQDKAIAYKKLLQKDKALNQHVSFLWRMSRACFKESVMAKLNGKQERHKKLLFTAKENAFKAVKMEPDNCEVHKWCAITIGSIGQFEGINTRIQYGYKFKEHIDTAIELCPRDATAQHLKGRWCYEVAQLSWVERKAAAAMFSAPPTSTIDDALDCFIESEKLKPIGSIDNQMFLGKCYIEKKDTKNALKWFKKARSLKTNGFEDEKSHEELDKLLYKWS